jgi:site-specific recombinase XerD
MDTIQHAIKGYLASLNSEHTQRSYGTALKHLRAFLLEQGTRAQESTDALSVNHAIDFVAWLRRREPAPAKATLQLYLTAIYRFYRYLLKRGADISATDLARLEESYRDARNIRGERRPVDHRLEAVRAIIAAAWAIAPDKIKARELARLRNVAIVETFRATGCRVGELVGLRLEDIDRQGKSADVKGQGSKWRKIYWDDVSWRALLAYLRARGVTEANAEPVFCGHGNRSGRTPAALTTRHVSRIVRKLRDIVVEQEVTPHYFRHIFATRALDKTGNLALVQDLLGHASPATTRVYAKTNDAQRQAAHGKIWQ